MSPGSSDSLERKTPAELIGLVRRLIGEVRRLKAENEKLGAALAAQRVENQTLKDEIARLEALPPRPPHEPSGMDKATDRPERRAEGREGIKSNAIQALSCRPRGGFPAARRAGRGSAG